MKDKFNYWFEFIVIYSMGIDINVDDTVFTVINIFMCIMVLTFYYSTLINAV